MGKTGKKRVLAISVILIIVCVLAGCGGSNNQAQAGGKAAGLSKKDKVTIKVAAAVSGYGRETYDVSVANFKKMYPNVTIEYTVSPTISELVTAKMQSGTDMYDLIMGTYGFTMDLCSSGKVEPMNDFMEMKTWDDKSKTMGENFFDSVKAQFTYDGKIYMAPIVTTVVAIIYNKKMFTENNWNESPANWGEFLTLCQTIKTGKNIPPIVFAGSVGYTPYLTQNASLMAGGKSYGENLVAKTQGIYSDPATLAPYAKLKELADKGYIMKGSAGLNHTQSQMEFLQGKAAMIPCGAWIENEMKESAPSDFQYGFMIPPTNDGAVEKRYVAGYPAGLYLWADKPAVSKQWTKEYLRYFYSNEVQSVYVKNGAIPAVKSALGGSPAKGGTAFMQNVFASLAQGDVEIDLYSGFASPVDKSAKMGELRSKILDDGYLAVYLGKKTPKQIGKEADALLEKAWADVGGRK